MRELPIPDVFDPENAADWCYHANPASLAREARAWRRRFGIGSGSNDRPQIQMLLVDVQRDFCLPEGTLFVGGQSGRGAIDDNRRLAEFIFRNIASLARITCTLDSHTPFQIFFPEFWVDAGGEPLEPNQEISAEQIRSGEIRPHRDIADIWTGGDRAWLEREVLHYCEELERGGRYRLYLWPPHCLIGGDGHALVGVIQEARLFHSYAREVAAPLLVKGGDPLTESYSVFGPEVAQRHAVPPPGAALSPAPERNERLIEKLLSADGLVVAGQAASHCVKSSLDDLLGAIGESSELARKVYVLEDCMSSVVVPDPNDPDRTLFDFTDETEAALARYREAGIHVVRSTEPMASWPGLA